MAQIVKVSGGREKVVDSGDRKKMLARLKELKQRTRGGYSGGGKGKRHIEYRLVD